MSLLAAGVEHGDFTGASVEFSLQDGGAGLCIIIAEGVPDEVVKGDVVEDPVEVV